MFLQILLIFILILSLWLCIKWTRVRRFWKDRNVPHHPPHHIFGSLTFLQKQNPTVFFRNLYKDFKAPYVGIWLFWRPALVINSPEIARRVLVKDADNFSNRYLSSGKSDPIGALNLFTVNNPAWSYLRHRLSPVFTTTKLNAVNGIAIEKSKLLIKRIRNDLENKKPINLRPMYIDITTDIFGQAAFGVKSDSIMTGDSSMRQITRQFMHFNTYRGFCWASIFFFPDLVDIFRLNFVPNSAVDILRKILRSQMEGRNADALDGESKDLVDFLLKLKKEMADDDKDLNEDILVAQAAIFLFGGFDTSASALSFGTCELAHHPHVQERLYEELLEAKEDNDDGFNSNVLSKLPYLNSVIKEILRKYPGMGWFDRIADKDYRIDENLTIPAGTTIYVNAAGMQADPEHFPDPQKFDPDRFSVEHEKNIKPFTFMPFGEGPRSCIGKRFGMLVLRHCIANLVYNFNIRPDPNSPPPSKFEFEKKGMFLAPGHDLYVQFIPKN